MVGKTNSKHDKSSKIDKKAINNKKKLDTGAFKKIVGGAKQNIADAGGGWDHNHNEVMV